MSDKISCTQVPDVSGYRLEDAVELLRAKGIKTINIYQTAPPGKKDKIYNGSSRVLRQVLAEDGSIGLLVCNTDLYK